MEKKKDRGSIVRIAVFAAAVLLLVFVFIFFGRRELISPASSSAATPEPTAVRMPSGVPLGRFIEALRAAWTGCALSEPQTLGGSRIGYTLETDNKNDSGSLTVLTDEYGRVREAELLIGYIDAGSGSTVASPAVLEVLKAEKKRRTEFDEELINTYLQTVYELFGSDYNIGSVDAARLTDSLISAYENGSAFSKKVGKGSFLCETSQDGTAFQYRLVMQFTLTK